MKKVTFKKLALLFILIMTFAMPTAGFAATNETSDKPSVWAVSDIEMAKKLGIMTEGVSSGFTKSITRQEFCELIVQTYEVLTQTQLPLPQNNRFVDTQNASVLKASEAGIVKGVSETEFSPNANITRQELAIMMMRTLWKLEEHFNTDLVVDYEISSTFSDLASISSWAKVDLLNAVENDLIKGVGNNLINPLGNTTKEQAIVMAKRLYFIAYNQLNHTEASWKGKHYFSNDILYGFDETNWLRNCVNLADRLQFLKKDGTVKQQFILEYSPSGWEITMPERAAYAEMTKFFVRDLGISDVIDLKGDKIFTIALKADGTVWQWYTPDNSMTSYVTDFLPEDVAPPEIHQVLGLEDIVSIDFQSSHGIALSKSGEIIQWDLENKLTKSKVDKEIVDVIAYNDCDLALAKDGSVYSLPLPGVAGEAVLQSQLTNISKIEASNNAILLLNNQGNVKVFRGALSGGLLSNTISINSNNVFLDISIIGNSCILKNDKGELLHFDTNSDLAIIQPETIEIP